MGQHVRVTQALYSAESFNEQAIRNCSSDPKRGFLYSNSTISNKLLSGLCQEDYLRAKAQLMATFVLVHGACHGGWCYSRVASRLKAQGHDVYTPTLSGLGERAHLASQSINLSTHIQDIVAMIEFEDLKDVVLCGHSYGGCVITGVAGQVPDRIKTLFYLDAIVPMDGQSLLDVFGAEETFRFLQWTGETGIMMASPDANYFGVNHADVEWVNKMCTPQPIGCFIQKLYFTGKEALVNRRTFVLAERNGTVNHRTYARVKTLPDWKTLSVDCGHEVMIDAPEVLVGLLLDELDR